MFLDSLDVRVNKSICADYIDPRYVNCKPAHGIEHKKRQVIYNPSKNYKFTSKIISANPDITFIPLKNLDVDGLIDVMD